MYISFVRCLQSNKSVQNGQPGQETFQQMHNKHLSETKSPADCVTVSDEKGLYI